MLMNSPYKDKPAMPSVSYLEGILNAMQSLFYGFTSVLLVIAVAALCTGVKKVMKKITKGGRKYDDQ